MVASSNAINANFRNVKSNFDVLEKLQNSATILELMKVEISNIVADVLYKANLLSEFESVEFKLANVEFNANRSYKYEKVSPDFMKTLKYKTVCKTLRILRNLKHITDKEYQTLIPPISSICEIGINSLDLGNYINDIIKSNKYLVVKKRSPFADFLFILKKILTTTISFSQLSFL